MTTEVVLALIAAVVTAAGWLVTNVLDREREHDRVSRESRARYLERQVEELYGPLFNLTMQIVTINHVRFEVVRETALDQRGAIDAMFYREYFMPLHDGVRELPKTKLHLVEGRALPESVYAYMRHSLQERVQRDLWLDHQIDTSAVQGLGFPDSFTLDVQQSLERLLAEYEEVLTGLHSTKSWIARLGKSRQVKPKEFTRDEMAS